MSQYYDPVCMGTAVTFVSIHEGTQIWSCDVCGERIIITPDMLENYSLSSGVSLYVHLRNVEDRYHEVRIPSAFYKAFEGEDD